MSKTQLKKFIDEYFKPRSPHERIYCKQRILPFAEKLIAKAHYEGLPDCNN